MGALDALPSELRAEMLNTDREPEGIDQGKAERRLMLVHLPPGLVDLLNALYWGQEDCDDEYQLFCRTWQEVRGWHQFHGSYSVNENEQRNLENFKLLWEQVEKTLEDGPLEFEKLAGPVYESVSIMNQVNEDRRFPHYSPIPAVNETLLAGAAFCLDQGSEQAVRDRLSLLNECLENLRGLYHEQSERFPEEVKATLSEGLELLQSGIEAVHHGLPDKAATRDGLADIKDGGSLAEFLLEWDRNNKQKLRHTYNRFNVPLIGAELEIGIETMKTVERRKWRRGARSTEEELFPQLDEFWAMIKPHLFLPPEEREEMIAEVEESYQATRDAVDALKGKEFEDDELLEAVTENLQWMSDAFTAIEQEALKPDVFGPGPEREIFEAVKGVLSGTVPDAALVELLRRSELPVVELEPFQPYLNEGDRESLHPAVWALLDATLERVESVESGPWTCTLCGHSNEAELLSCGQCRVIRKSTAEN